jgi:copper(I)-binding protein
MVGAFALAGCGAGQITQTSSQASGVGGASANIGQLAVREAAFAFAGDGKTSVIYPSGGTAPLTMTVVNFGPQDDKLTGASSPAAASVQITGDATIASGRLLLVNGEPAGEPAGSSAQATPAPGRATPAPSGARATPGATATPTPGAEATPAPSARATAAPSAEARATAAPSAEAPSTASPEDTAAAGPTAAAGAAPPSGAPVAPGTTTAQVVLTGLKQNLMVGPTYPVVLTFQRAGEVTVQVPVANPPENQGPTGE